MKYLNDRITVSLTFSDLNLLDIPTGIYTYSVKRVNLDSTVTSLFYGNFYWNGESTYTFDITDIVNNDKWVPTFDDISNNVDSDVNLFNSYCVTTQMNTVNNNTPTTWTSNTVAVAKVYKYPNIKTNLTGGYFDIGTYTRNKFSILLLGKSSIAADTTLLIPEYPLFEHDLEMATSNYPFGIAIEVGSSVETLTLDAHYENDDYALGSKTLTFNTTSSTHAFLEDGIGNIFQYNANPVSKVLITITADSRTATAAVFNPCYSKYYLFWQDRYGSFLSQPFKEAATFTEDFNVSEVQNYKNERHISNIQAQSKWKINSGWLSEDVYPLYESIFVSPILVLYDTTANKTYNVIVKDKSYTEKTYKNQKGLLNITFELEEFKKQNIIY